MGRTLRVWNTTIPRCAWLSTQCRYWNEDTVKGLLRTSWSFYAKTSARMETRTDIKKTTQKIERIPYENDGMMWQKEPVWMAMDWFQSMLFFFFSLSWSFFIAFLLTPTFFFMLDFFFFWRKVGVYQRAPLFPIFLLYIFRLTRFLTWLWLEAQVAGWCWCFVVRIFFVGTPGSAAPFIVFLFFHGENQVALLFLVDCARVDRWRNGTV